MVLGEMSKIFERRRKELYTLLTERKEEIKPEVQHQMYGAMNEIDIFIKTIDYYRKKEIDMEIKNAVLVGPMIKESLVSRFVNKLNNRISRIK